MHRFGQHHLLAIASDERGQGVAEYALVLGFVALAAIGVLSTIGPALLPALKHVSTTLN